MAASVPPAPDPQLAQVLRSWLADAEQREAALLSAGNQGAAYLYSGEVGGVPRMLVLKRAGSGLLSGWFHALMLRREAVVYQRLADVAGVPHSPGLLDNEWLVLDYVEGRSLKHARYELEDESGFYEQLLNILHDVHAAGVAHGDLKRKDNVLVTAGEVPCVIDFGTAVLRDGSLFDRLMFRLVRRFDYNAWIKVKYRNDYSAITVADRRWYRPTLVELAFRQLQRFWRLVSLRQPRKHWRRARDARKQKN